MEGGGGHPGRDGSARRGGWRVGQTSRMGGGRVRWPASLVRLGGGEQHELMGDGGRGGR
jgi:hypothetical protein